MNNTGSVITTDIRKCGTSMSQSIDKCAGTIPDSGMYDQTGRFIYHDQIIIFINYIKRNVFGFYRKRNKTRNANCDHIFWCDVIGCFFSCLAIDSDQFPINQFFDFSPREIFNRFANKSINTCRSLRSTHSYTIGVKPICFCI